MKRFCVLLAVAGVLSGCCRRAPVRVVDPFLGRTVVVPPATGAASIGPADPYYRNTPNSMTPPTPVPQITPGTPDTGTQPSKSGQTPGVSTPSEDFDYPGFSTPGTPLSDPYSPQTPATPLSFSARPTPSDSLGASRPPTRERVVRVLKPRPKTAAGSVGEQEGGFRLVSAIGEPGCVESAPPKGKPSVAAVEFTSQADYGHDADHTWLRGKLEHSQIDRQWKLRYIPIGETTDEFGGSVVLPDPTLLSGCERGDFIEVHGKIRKGDPPKGCSHSYEVARVERFRPGAE